MYDHITSCYGISDIMYGSLLLVKLQKGKKFNWMDPFCSLNVLPVSCLIH